MKKIDFDIEWKFIESEIRKEQPNKNNLLKRELLFILQTLLPDISNSFQKKIYLKSKQLYLTF